MALARIDRVKSDLKDRVRFDGVNVAVFLEGPLFEMSGEFLDLDIRETRIGLPDNAEFAGFFIADGESVVAQNMRPFPVSLLRFDDDDIEGRHRFLQLQPLLSAASRRIGARGIFRNEAFVIAAAGLVEGLVNLFGGGGMEHLTAVDGTAKSHFLQQGAAFT